MICVTIDLRTVDWGTGDAKSEISQFQNQYNDIFIEIDDRKMINEKNHLILWGRRGCGKTAMAWKLSNVKYKKNREVVKIDFEDSEDWVDAVLAKSGLLRDAIGFPFRKSYTDLWYHSILIEMMWSLLNSNNVYITDKKIIELYLSKYKKNEGVLYTLLNKLDDLYEILDDIDSKKPLVLTAKGILKLREHLSGSIDFSDAVKVLGQNLNNNPDFKIRIVVDSVDKWMLPSKFKREAEDDFLLLSLVIRSLIRALIKINTNSRFKNSVEIKAFLPLDLRPFIEDRASAHEAMYHHIMHWRGIELAALIAKRISRSNNLLDDKYDYIDTLKAWDNIFQFQITNNTTNVKHKPFDYLLRHSQFRPREILICCRKMSEYARKHNISNLNEQEFRDIVHEHCSEEAERIIEEFKVPFPNIYDILSKFTGISNILKSEEVFNLLKNVSLPSFILNTRELIQFLYNVGFLGVMIDESEKNELGKNLPLTTVIETENGHIVLPYTKVQRKTSYFSFKFIDPSRKIVNANTFVIHPIFYGKFSIRAHEKITVCHHIIIK